MTIEDDLFTIMDALTFDVYDGDIPVDESQKVVTVPCRMPCSTRLRVRITASGCVGASLAAWCLSMLCP